MACSVYLYRKDLSMDSLMNIPKTIPKVLVVAALLLAQVVFSETACAQPVLDELVSEALANNPEIKASQARWDTLINRAKQAGSLEDPMLMLRAQSLLVRDPLDFGRENMTSKVIGISQMLPFYGKRALKREVADLAAEANRWLVEERRLELQRMVKETWYQVYFVDQALALIDRTIAALDDLTRFTEVMYGVGGGLQQDVLKAQLQRSRMEDMRIALQQRRRSLEATLNTLVYRPTDVAVPPVNALELTAVNIDAASLEGLAEAQRPILKSLQAQISKAHAGRRLADKEFYPDFTVSFEYMQREPTGMGSEGYDMYSAGLSFNLPIQRERRHAMVAETEAEIRMAEQERAMLQNQIRLGIADSLARLERSRKQATLYRDGILPQATHALAASMSAYRVGKADFMNVIDGQMRLFDVEREYHDAVAEHQMQLAQLENLVGVAAPFDAAPPAANNPVQGSE